MSIKITARKNGPFFVEGDLSELSITDSDGNSFDYQPVNIGGKPQVILCRCGGSTTKPFCDGTHGKIGFEAAEAAVEKE